MSEGQYGMWVILPFAGILLAIAWGIIQFIWFRSIERRFDLNTAMQKKLEHLARKREAVEMTKNLAFKTNELKADLNEEAHTRWVSLYKEWSGSAEVSVLFGNHVLKVHDDAGGKLVQQTSFDAMQADPALKTRIDEALGAISNELFLALSDKKTYAWLTEE
jgi:hypothetical protein